jgi:hypothetical protein
LADFASDLSRLEARELEDAECGRC